MKDPAFLAEASKRNAPVDAVSGEKIAAIVNKGCTIAPATLQKMKAMIGLGGKGK